jgi:hypothetical protein
LEAAAETSPEGEPSSQLLGLIAGTPRGRLVNVIDSLLWAGLIFVMVVKPFGV